MLVYGDSSNYDIMYYSGLFCIVVYLLNLLLLFNNDISMSTFFTVNLRCVQNFKDVAGFYSFLLGKP